MDDDLRLVPQELCRLSLVLSIGEERDAAEQLDRDVRVRMLRQNLEPFANSRHIKKLKIIWHFKI